MNAGTNGIGGFDAGSFCAAGEGNHAGLFGCDSGFESGFPGFLSGFGGFILGFHFAAGILFSITSPGSVCILRFLWDRRVCPGS